MVETDPNHLKTLFQNKLNSNGVVWTVAVMGFCPHSSSLGVSSVFHGLLYTARVSEEEYQGQERGQELAGATGNVL